MTDRPDTRRRIQAVALELFIEQGYDKTSLREIAERLGVTKAALYYHFPTKDDIVSSLIEDRVARVEALVEWARDNLDAADVRYEIIRRYVDDTFDDSAPNVMRFLERNQTALKGTPAAERMRRLLHELVRMLSDPTDPPAVRLRSAMALFAVHGSVFMLDGEQLTIEERRAAALEVALGLVGRE